MDFTTLDAVKLWLGITSTADDDLLTSLITAVSAAMVLYLARDISSQNYTETRDGSGGTRMAFQNYPVTAISQVQVDGTNIPPSPAPLQPGYVFDDRFITLYGYCFTAGRSNVQLGYTAGYADIPAEIAQAATELAALRYAEKDRIGVNAQSVGSETVHYLVRTLPMSVQAVLDAYRKVIPL